jgi:hypothetical protein
MTILKDPVRPFNPSLPLKLETATTETSRPEPPPHPAEDVRAAVRPRGPIGKTSFELASRGGYVRRVTGAIAYQDEQAETYMVLADGELLRVPLRDVTSRHEETPSDETDRSSAHDEQGLGTG